jgi:hypothetical protein
VCDPYLKQRPTDPLGYRLRGDRCEGLYIAEVGSTALHIASFTRSVDDYDPAQREHLLLRWSAPNPGAIQLQAMGLRPRLYYRMDTARASDPPVYRWPTNVLADLKITRKDLGIVARTRLPVGSADRAVYLPLSIGGGQAAATQSYKAVLWPGRELTEVFVSVAPVGADGRPGPYVRDGPLKYGYYPADRGVTVDLPMSALPGRGVYYLLLAATLQGGGSSSVEGWFYHPGS